MQRKKKRGHTKDRHADYSVEALMIDQDFQVMSTTNTLTSIFWDPSFTLGDCRMDMTDCRIKIHATLPLTLSMYGLMEH